MSSSMAVQLLGFAPIGCNYSNDGVQVLGFDRSLSFVCYFFPLVSLLFYITAQ
jgi:hypothetical protein